MGFRSQQAEHRGKIKDSHGHRQQGPAHPPRHPTPGNQESQEPEHDPAGPDMHRVPVAECPGAQAAGQTRHEGHADEKPASAQGHQPAQHQERHRIPQQMHHAFMQKGRQRHAGQTRDLAGPDTPLIGRPSRWQQPIRHFGHPHQDHQHEHGIDLPANRQPLPLDKCLFHHATHLVFINAPTAPDNHSRSKFIQPRSLLPGPVPLLLFHDLLKSSILSSTATFCDGHPPHPPLGCAEPSTPTHA